MLFFNVLLFYFFLQLQIGILASNSNEVNMIAKMFIIVMLVAKLKSLVV